MVAGNVRRRCRTQGHPKGVGLYWPANGEEAANRPGRRQRTSSDRPHHQRRFRYSDFGVATSVATVTLLDEQDRKGNAKFGSWLSTRRVEPPWRINTARESSWTANDLTPPEDGTPKGPQRGHCLAAAHVVDTSPPDYPEWRNHNLPREETHDPPPHHTDGSAKSPGLSPA